MKSLNRIRSTGSEQMETRELLSGHSFGGGQAGTGFGGSKGGFGGSKGGFGGAFNGSSSSSSSSSSQSGGSYSSGSYESNSSSYESGSSYSGGYSSYSSGGGSWSGGCHRWGYSSGYAAGYSTGYQTGFNDGVSYATSSTDNQAPTDQCQQPQLPQECPTPAPEPTPPAPPTPGPSSDYSTGYFNGNQYNLLKQNGTKYTYKNYNLPGGSRTIDYNTITGTWRMHSPIAFDLNGSGKIETTGASTAQNRIGNDPVGATVSFDIDGNGTKENIEWMAGTGDGLLVDNRDGKAATSMDGSRLFGDQGGQFANGYDKLARLDKNHDGQLTGRELKGLQVWVDNGDAQVQAGELKSLSELQINQISVRGGNVTNSRGESLMQSSAIQGSNQIMSEDVWFAQNA